MRKSTPQNLARTFKDRSMGMFRKAAQLHAIDGTVRISIVIEKPGQIPLVFSTDEVGFEWPNLTQQYVDTHRPLVKRPSHFVSLDESISRGQAKILRPCSSSSPQRPETPEGFPSSSPRPRTPDNFLIGDEREEDEDSEGPNLWRYSCLTPQKTPSRHSSPLPRRTSIVLPSKRLKLENGESIRL